MVQLAYDEKSCGGGLDFWGMFSNPVGTMIKMVAKIVMSGALGLFQASFTNIDSTDTESATQVSGDTRWIVVYLAVGSLLFAAIKMAIDRRGDSGTLALKGLMRVVVVSAVATSVINSFAILMEDYSSYLLASSIRRLMNGIDCSDTVPAMVMLIVGCLLIIAAIIQMILLWVRLGVMVLLMGTLPMAAAASMTEWGGTWWRKHLGWMVAWLLYKPAVGLVVYTGAVLIEQTGTNQVDTQIAGMAMLLLSSIALPALLRLVVPATAALGGDSVGSATMGVAGGIASGAKSIGQAAGGAAASGASGASGARGPSGSDGGGGSSGSKGESGDSGSSGFGGRSGGSSPGGGGGGGGSAAAGTAVAGVAAGVLAAGHIAKTVAKGASDIAQSGIEGANREDEHHR